MLSKKTKPLGLILAGGESKRLFPVSIPKPLLQVEGKFLVQEALERLKDFDTYIVTNAKISKEIISAFRKAGLKIPAFILEPEPRDTAAAVGFGILEALKKSKEPPSFVAVLSADHYMKESKKFPQFLKDAQKEVGKYPGALFVGGSAASKKPLNSHSQFGWVLPATALSKKGSAKVAKFVEKPKGRDLEEIRKSGGLINAGMFFGRPETFLSAYEALYPNILKKPLRYEKLERQPVDRAIFEKYNHVRVLKLDLAWEDLGTWQDWQSHTASQFSRHFSVHSKNSYLKSDEDFEIYAFGVENLAIIQSGKRILVVPLSESKKLKEYLAELD